MGSQENNFWKPRGYEGCLEKIKNGINLIMLLEEFARERARLSERYAKDMKELLEKSFKKVVSYKEEGTFKDAWMSFFDETDQIAKAQQDMSASINKQMNEDFKEWKRKNLKETNPLKDIRNSFLETEKQWMRLLGDSENKRKKYSSAVNSLRSIENNHKQKPQNDGTPKDAKKLEKYNQVVVEEKTTDKAYNESLSTLREAEGSFRKDMEANYESYRKFEESRMNFLRDSFKSLLEVFEKFSVTETSPIYTRAYEEMEKIDISKDLDSLYDKLGPAGGFPVYEYQNCEKTTQQENQNDDSNSDLSNQ